MKSLGTNLLWTLALGLAVAGGVWVLGLEPATQTAGLVGAGVSTAVGALALVVKTAAPVNGGLRGVQAVLSRQALSLFLRLGTLGLGAFALRNAGGEPMAFVLTFFLAYLGQQVVEVRGLLAVRQSAAKSGVTP